MRYISTRGQASRLAFDDVLLAGLAEDGGLYVPETWPRLAEQDWEDLAALDYPALAARIMKPFMAGSVAEGEIERLCREAYASFAHQAVAPLRQVDRRTWLMELFHGPTLAFKDVALQLLGGLFDQVLSQRGERITIVGATSGDTGSAAIEACRDRENLDIFILFPQGRVSEVQRRQMTTVGSNNVHTIAIEGTFDDCQAMVKAMFADAEFRKATGLAAVNSINWARILAQSVYYIAGGLALGAPQRPVAFSVPTGNFGNIYAGYVARKLGLPIERLIVGSNRNDILTRFFESGRMETGEVFATLSPSMDIQVSSNFERLLLDLHGGDSAAVAQAMGALKNEGRFTLSQNALAETLGLFRARRLDDEETLAEIARVEAEAAMVLDPHSAIGLRAARLEAPEDPSIPVIALATAHPAKFPDAVRKAVGHCPALPPRLADLHERQERYASLPNEFSAVTHYIRERSRRAAAAA